MPLGRMCGLCAAAHNCSSASASSPRSNSPRPSSRQRACCSSQSIRYGSSGQSPRLTYSMGMALHAASLKVPYPGLPMRASLLQRRPTKGIVRDSMLVTSARLGFHAAGSSQCTPGRCGQCCRSTCVAMPPRVTSTSRVASSRRNCRRRQSRWACPVRATGPMDRIRGRLSMGIPGVRRRKQAALL